jgi:16S rRNA (uracil1498-N3)-methyltransferase
VNLFYQPQLSSGHNFLDPEESRHCVRVLRRRNGDDILITDGQGMFYDAVITEANPDRCAFMVKETRTETVGQSYTHIAVSPTKNADRIEWFVEKAVEIGVNEISLVECEHSERTFIKTERLTKVAISAMKQSLKATLPVINPVQPVNALFELALPYNKFIAHVDLANPLHLRDAPLEAAKTLVLIGPEGDFSGSELDSAFRAGYKKVSLGRSRLRTETAALVACLILNFRSDI